MVGLFPHLVNALMGHLACLNNPRAIQAAVEKYTAQRPTASVQHERVAVEELGPAAQSAGSLAAECIR